MHGVLRLIVTLDGEDVIDCEPILGYLHRGMEKNWGKPNNYTIFALCNTLGLFSYYVHRSNNSKWGRNSWEIFKYRKRASYIRVILLELSRIASHLLWLGPFMADIVDHYESYDEFDWEVPWQKEGDSLARYLVRIGEMTESITIIQQALERIPGGSL
ncbi:NAD(P)H-quinone oxidoreductase subunit H, chloroplastic [Linum perenne]